MCPGNLSCVLEKSWNQSPQGTPGVGVWDVLILTPDCWQVLHWYPVCSFAQKQKFVSYDQSSQQLFWVQIRNGLYKRQKVTSGCTTLEIFLIGINAHNTFMMCGAPLVYLWLQWSIDTNATLDAFIPKIKKWLASTKFNQRTIIFALERL